MLFISHQLLDRHVPPPSPLLTSQPKELFHRSRQPNLNQLRDQLPGISTIKQLQPSDGDLLELRRHDLLALIRDLEFPFLQRLDEDGDDLAEMFRVV